MTFVDVESGTVLNGPIKFVEQEIDFDSLSDSDVSAYAEAHGLDVEPVTVAEQRVLYALQEWDDDEWEYVFGFTRDTA